MAFAIHESVMVRGVRLFKLNQYSDLIENQFLFLIHNRFPFSGNSEIGPISYNFGFDLRSLSPSRDSLQQLCFRAVESTQQFIDPNNVRKLAAGFSDYLAGNFEFDLDTLWRNPNSPKIVIVADVERSLGFLESRVKTDSNRPSSGIEEHEDGILPALKNLLNLPDRSVLERSDSEEPHGLSRVPALDVFDKCHGRSGSCAICLEELLSEGMDVRKMPCNHVFHGGCVARWLWRKSSCPVCRSRLI